MERPSGEGVRHDLANGPLGVVVIGAGDLGSRHAQHWHAAGARVVAVCDPWLERAREVAALVGAEAATHPGAHLSRDDVHVVSVCTPTFLHESYTVAAIEAGKHVLCEKPAALTVSAAERMKAAAELHDRELRLGLMRRFDPAHHEILRRHALLGGPTLAQTTIVAGLRPKRMMHDARGNGGPVIDMCCHLFDLWRVIFDGQPESVSAHGYTFAEGRSELASIEEKALDSALFTLTYPGGRVGQVQISWGLPSGVQYIERHSYVGPDGLLIVNWNNGMSLYRGPHPEHWDAPEHDAWRAHIAQFYRELTEGAPRQVATIDDGIDALRISLAVLRSVAERREVRLDEELERIPPLEPEVLG